MLLCYRCLLRLAMCLTRVVSTDDITV
jgi:hypothetical protein